MTIIFVFTLTFHLSLPTARQQRGDKAGKSSKKNEPSSQMEKYRSRHITACQLSACTRWKAWSVNKNRSVCEWDEISSAIKFPFKLSSPTHSLGMTHIFISSCESRWLSHTRVWRRLVCGNNREGESQPECRWLATSGDSHTLIFIYIRYQFSSSFIVSYCCSSARIAHLSLSLIMRNNGQWYLFDWQQ